MFTRYQPTRAVLARHPPPVQAQPQLLLVRVLVLPPRPVLLLQAPLLPRSLPPRSPPLHWRMISLIFSTPSSANFFFIALQRLRLPPLPLLLALPPPMLQLPRRRATLLPPTPRRWVLPGSLVPLLWRSWLERRHELDCFRILVLSYNELSYQRAL